MNAFSRYQRYRILNARSDIFNAEIWIVVVDNLIKREVFIKEFENILDCYARACHARFSKMNLGINNNSICHVALPNAIANVCHVLRPALPSVQNRTYPFPE